MTEYRFIEPLDVLFLRGNRQFGEAGEHGEALMPPWPALAAGALRSRMLVDAAVPLDGFAAGERPAGALGEVLGTPAQPGSFRLCHFGLARRGSDGAVEALFPAPADLVIDDGGAKPLHPVALHPALASGYPLSRVPALCSDDQGRPKRGQWLTSAGLSAYVAGRAPVPEQWIGPEALWRNDARLGIALDPGSRTAAESQLYTAEAVAFHDGVGFLAGAQGAGGLLPEDGLLRLGGDGRGAKVRPCEAAMPQPAWARIEGERRFRLILTTPGLFPNGWRPPGLEDGDTWVHGGCRARLVAAAVPRAEVVSGWDLARWCPKAAQRAVPAGAVYWFDGLEGPAEALAGIAAGGLDGGDATRRAEGFNNCLIAPWAE